MKNNKNIFAIILITSLFFLWGFAHNLNPILIPHLKKACQLSDLQSALIDSAFYIAYFLMAIPAGLFMKKFGYKGGILLGLFLFATGAFLFYPAAETRIYILFLGALFVIASGLTFLETAANPYITVLGDSETATQRINFAQSFNGLAAFIAPRIGGMYILSGIILTKEQEAAMGSDQFTAYLNSEAQAVQIPYFIIGITVLLVALFLWRTSLPEIEDKGTQESWKSIFKEKNLMLGVMAQFFYVGAQVCVNSFFIRFADQAAGLKDKSAAEILSYALLAFMVGRFSGTFFMKYVAPAKLLAIYCVISVCFLFMAVSLDGIVSLYTLVGVQFFMSIMFPTIFSLGIQGLGSKTKQGSSLLIMSIVGGAIFPVIMGFVSDKTHSIQTAYLVPAACFFFVLYFALKNIKVKVAKIEMAH